MQDFIFATALFLVYFCAASCFLYNPESATAVTTLPATSEPKEEVVVDTPQVPQELEVSIEIDGNDWTEEERAVISSNPAILESFLPPVTPQESSLDELLEGIEVEQITLRQARKIAKRLGIKQTVTNNGKKKDKPLNWLRREIRQSLEKSPETAAPVIHEVLSVA
ncbi:MAG: hypothetical protein F6K14_08620 [Symploca sp. SIO2C1]|nr:hypothetical protein [Symploca sp. SIO2C1]